MAVTEYSKTIRITQPECDIQNMCKLSFLMRHLQEVSSEHLEELGLGQDILWKEGFVYLLTRVNLQIKRRPKAMEKIKLTTKPRGAKGVQSYRDIYYYDETGEEIIYAKSAWVLVEPNSHRIRRPKELPHTIAIEEFDYCYGWAKSHLNRPDHAALVEQRKVRYSEIDVNRHMNNAVYSDIVCDCLPLSLYEQFELEEYTISFAGEVQLGDTIDLYLAQTGEYSWYVGADRPAGDRCFEAVLQYRRKS